MTNRTRLDNRRAAEHIAFDYKGHPMIANVGTANAGRIKELFLVHAGKAGTDLNISMLEVSVAVSMALQHGCDLDTLREAMPRGEHNEPQGVIGKLLDILAEDVKPQPRLVTP